LSSFLVISIRLLSMLLIVLISGCHNKRFMTELVLVISDLVQEIRVEIDILYFVIRGVLSIKCENKK